MPRADLETLVTHLLQANPQWYQHDGILPITTSTGQKVAQQLLEHVERIRIYPAGVLPILNLNRNVCRDSAEDQHTTPLDSASCCSNNNPEHASSNQRRWADELDDACCV